MAIHAEDKIGDLMIWRRPEFYSAVGKSWECICKCGSVINVLDSMLSGGAVTNCGCALSGRPLGCKDYSNEVFGCLTAVRYVSLTVNKNSIWCLRCTCGQFVVRAMRYVQPGLVKSCGCRRIEMSADKRTLPNEQGLKNFAHYTHVRSAKKRGLDSQLTKEQYVQIASQPCHYCGEVSVRKHSNFTRSNKKIKTGLLNSVDRLNNEPYYKLENSVPACFDCQQKKMDDTEVEFAAHIKKIYDYQSYLKGDLDDGTPY